MATYDTSCGAVVWMVEVAKFTGGVLRKVRGMSYSYPKTESVHHAQVRHKEMKRDAETNSTAITIVGEQYSGKDEAELVTSYIRI